MTSQIQAISRILITKDFSFYENNFTIDDFIGYEDEINFIVDHYREFGNVPDEVTFLSKFQNFEIAEVTESDRFIIDEVHENRLYIEFGKHLTTAASMMKTNSNDAVEYMKNVLGAISPSYSINSTNIIESVDERIQHSQEVSQNMSDWFIPTGFEELDADINGFQRGDELVVIYARTNDGKSWISEKIATYMAEIGFRVGYFSPEMSERDIGYRFDTLHGHLSNNAMRLGKFNNEFSIDDYEKYAERLQKLTGKLYVTRPKNFARVVTVSKIRRWIESDKLDAVFIDGITYLTDERYKKGDSKTISLTNISEDLMELTSEMHIPIVVVVQANRGGITDKKSTDTPELENIRDSDGIAQNASIVYGLKQLRTREGEVYLIFDNKKMRGGEVGKSYKYRWDINTGNFEYVTDDAIPKEDSDTEDRPKRAKKESTAVRVNKRKKEAEDDY